MEIMDMVDPEALKDIAAAARAICAEAPDADRGTPQGRRLFAAEKIAFYADELILSIIYLYDADEECAADDADKGGG